MNAHKEIEHERVGYGNRTWMMYGSCKLNILCVEIAWYSSETRAHEYNHSLKLRSP